MAGQVDRFGRPIPADPGYKEIINYDGEVVQMRTTLFLDETITASDDPNSDATRLSASSAVAASSAIQGVADVAALRAWTPSPHDGDLFVTQGYATAGDGGQSMYRWDSASTDDDTGALTIKITSRATGRLKYVDLSAAKVFPLRASPVNVTGAVNITTELLALVVELTDAGYNGLNGDFGMCKLSPGEGFKIPPREEGIGFKFSKIKFTGTGNLNGPFGPWLYALPTIVGKPTTVLANAYEGVYCWNGSVAAGDDTFVGVEVRAGLTIGMTIIVYLGADTTNIGGADSTFYAKILDIIPTSGTTCTVQIDRVVPRTPPTCNGVLHSVPSWNENINRTSVRHNFCPVTAFQDNLEFEDCTFDDCYPLMAGTRNALFTRTTINKTYFGFRLDNAFDTYFDGVYVYNLTGGFPADPPNYSANYGFIFTNYGSYGTVVNNFTGRNIEASGGVWDEELQGDGVHFTGTTRANFSNKTDLGVHSGWFVGIRLTQQITIDRLFVTGNGNVVNNGRINIVQYECWAPPSTLTTDVTRILAMRWNDEEWNTPKTALVEMRNIAVNATSRYLIPVRGILRSFRLFANSLTGITDVLLERDDSGTFSVLSFLTAVGANKWAECDTFLTQLGFSFATYGGRVIAIQVITDGTFVPGKYVLADVQMLTQSRAMNSLLFTDDSLPQKISGVGRPSLDAQFVGQTYTDDVSGTVYTSRSVGYGARDWSFETSPAFGAYLSDSDQTLVPGGTAGEYINENGTQSAGRTKTISTSGASNGDRLLITNYETASHTMAIVNGGIAGGTIYTFAGTVAKQLSIVFDGINWGSPTVIPVS